MILTYDEDNLKTRQRSEFRNEKGELRYWGIYDFSYKYRTRIYDERDVEVFYVEKYITEARVGCYDAQGKLLGEVSEDGNDYVGFGRHIKNDEGYKCEGVFSASRGILEISNAEDLAEIIMIMYALIEIKR